MDLINTRGYASNGYKQYLKSRPGASRESLKRSKEFKELRIGAHPALRNRAVNEPCTVPGEGPSFESAN